MYDILGLDGKVAVVTGGGGNIGAATAAMLASSGARVAVVDIDEDKARAAAAAAGKDAAVKPIAIRADTCDDAEIARVADTVTAEWGRVDVDVNIVGGGVSQGGSLDLGDEDWHASVEINLMSAVRCARRFASLMINSDVAGSIVNIASPAGLRAAPGMVAYGATKAALINFTWTLAVEVARYGIRANVVVPAFVPGPNVFWGGSAEEQAELARRNVPMGRVTTAKDVAGAIIAFASSLTSYSTGQVLVCDGGRLLINPVNTGIA